MMKCPLRPIGDLSLLVIAVHLGIAGCREPKAPEDRSPASITVTPATSSFVALGATVRLSAAVRDRRGNPVAGAVVSWHSSDVAVASVSTDGLVTAHEDGTAILTASSPAASGSAAVNVIQRAHHLKLDLAAPYVAAGIPINTALQVSAHDSLDALMRTTVSLSVALAGGAVAASLSGPTNATTTSGVATFPDLVIDRVGADYTLVASTQNAGDRVTASTSPFSVVRLVYVAMIDSNTVSVVETGTNSVVAKTAVGAAPVDVAITPDGRFAYVSNRDHGTVSVLSTSTNSVVATIALGGRLLQEITISPNGSRAYVAAQIIPGRVSVVSTSTNTVLDSIRVDDVPVSLAISPDGSRLYAGHQFSHTVSVIATGTNSVTATVPLPSEPRDIAISPTGSPVYALTPAGLYFIDATTNAVVDSIPFSSNTEGLALTSDGSLAYVTEPVAGRVSVFRLATKSLVTSVTVANPVALAWSPDGQLLYVSSRNNTVSVISAASNTVVQTIAVRGARARLAVTPF